MGKAACAFKETDLTRAFRAAKKAGVAVSVEIDLERKRMRLTPIEIADSKVDAGGGANDWDSIYEQS